MSEKQRGLGRGLSALLGDTLAVRPEVDVEVRPNMAGDMGVVLKPVEWLERNPDQPRRFFSDQDIEDLAASIREKGVLQPILVRTLSAAPERYQIVAGERRWRASQKAGLHEVPVLIRELNDLDVLEIAIVENVQRQDLNPIEEAQAYKTLMERFGRTQDAVAQVVSKSRSHIANMMRLLTLPQAVQDHVLHGRLSAGHARALITAQEPQSLADIIINKGLSVRQTEALAREGLKDKLEASSEDKSKHKTLNFTDSDTQALEQDLQEALGLNVRLEDRGGRGELRLSYANLEQLDDLCRRLMRASS
jgi:ParB family transcriptional regulator, chromosome partitioning protein